MDYKVGDNVLVVRDFLNNSLNGSVFIVTSKAYSITPDCFVIGVDCRKFKLSMYYNLFSEDDVFINLSKACRAIRILYGL